MTAFARLWRRAPAWRAVLVAACASTGLAVIYNDGLAPLQRRPSGAGAAQSSTAGSYVPAPPVPLLSPPIAPPPPQVAASAPSLASQAAAAPPMSAMPATSPAPAPPFGQGYSGTVPFAGRFLPLPAGEWVVVGANSGRTPPDGRVVASAMLARTEGGRMTGAVIAFGSEPRSGLALPPADYECQKAAVLYGRVRVALDHGPQDSWCVTPFFASAWDAPDQPPVMRAGIGELRQRGTVLPQAGLRAFFLRADAESWLKVHYFFDEREDGPAGQVQQPAASNAASGMHPNRDAFLGRVRTWANRWYPLMRRAFARELASADVTPDLARLR